MFSQFCMQERDIISTLISCITSYGQNGIPLTEIQEEFEALSGYDIPFRKFGFDNIRSFLMTLPDIYIVKDMFNNEVVIEQSRKTSHIKNLISNQKNQKRKFASSNNNCYMNKKQKTANSKLPKGTSIHSSFNRRNLTDSNRFGEFQKLEEMFPILYKHQALGDDFFVDLADKKLGYYVSDIEKTCGLCEVGITISELTNKIKNAELLAPRVVVMVGLNDLLMGRNATNMILDLRNLIEELKKRNTRVTIVTLIPSPKLKMNQNISFRMELYNKAILEYASDPDLQCNIIDMHKIFQTEIENFKKDFNRLEKISKNDQHKVFSDYGRKIFLAAIKSCLKEQIDHGH